MIRILIVLLYAGDGYVLLVWTFSEEAPVVLVLQWMAIIQHIYLYPTLSITTSWQTLTHSEMRPVLCSLTSHLWPLHTLKSRKGSSVSWGPVNVVYWSERTALWLKTCLGVGLSPSTFGLAAGQPGHMCRRKRRVASALQAASHTESWDTTQGLARWAKTNLDMMRDGANQNQPTTNSCYIDDVLHHHQPVSVTDLYSNPNCQCMYLRSVRTHLLRK